MTKTIRELLDETSDHFMEQGLTPVEIGIWVQCDGGPYQVTDTRKLKNGEYGVTYVSLTEDETDSNDLYTMHDLYKQLRKDAVKPDDQLVTICDDGDFQYDEDDREKPVKSFRFEDGVDNVEAAKVILVC